MRYLMSPNVVLCFLPWFASFQNDFQHNSQTSLPLTNLWEEDKMCLETFILLSSLQIISTKGDKLERLQSGGQVIQVCRTFTSFLPARKYLLSLAVLPSTKHFCCIYLMRENSHKNSHREKLLSSHSLNQFRTEGFYWFKNIQLTSNHHPIHSGWILATPYNLLITMLVRKLTMRLHTHVWGAGPYLLHPTIH